MSLQPPPKKERPTRVLARLVVLSVLVVAVGFLVWSSVIGQRIDLIETAEPADFELESPSLVDGLTINVVTEPGGPTPVVLLHDVDVAGGVLWDGVVGELGEEYTPVRIDLPGFGLSSRIVQEGRLHTVASMGDVVATVLAERFVDPVIMAGVGMGGKVAAEVTVTRPDLVAGLVLVDVDFWDNPTWTERLERLPFVGRAFAHTFETGGALGMRRWAPQCAEGGWCPTAHQQERRNQATTVRGSTDSIWSFRRTPPASLVPSDLDQITVPVMFVWSTDGDVPSTSVGRLEAVIGHLQVTEAEAWKAHLEMPDVVAAAVAAVGPG